MIGSITLAKMSKPANDFFFSFSKMIHLDFEGIRKTQIWGSWKWNQE